MSIIQESADLSLLAYSPRDVVLSRLDVAGYKNVHWYSQNGTQAFLADHGTDRWVVFRGTQPTDREDWVADLRFSKMSTSFGMVHRGFVHALFDVWPDMRMKALEQFEVGKNRFMLAGHSLGAALATIAAASLGETVAFRPSLLATFGSPRVGDGDFAMFVQAHCRQTLRFVNNNDIVARVPVPLPSWTKRLWPVGWFRKYVDLAVGYKHVGVLHYFDSGGMLHIAPSKSYLFYDRLRGRWYDFGRIGTDGLKDHSMERYVVLLSENIHDNGKFLDL